MSVIGDGVDAPRRQMESGCTLKSGLFWRKFKLCIVAA